MKKYLNIALAAFAALAIIASCTKEIASPVEDEKVPEENQGTTPSKGEVVTISATISDVLTKVSFDPTYSGGKPTSLALTWADGDQIRVYDHADRSKYDDFTLDAGSIGQKTGEFSGTPSNIGGASTFDVEVLNGAFDYASQTQPSDGVTTGLKYLASASNIADYSSVVFTDFSSVLAITAKMPSTEVVAAIKSVDITASEAIFNGGNTLTITLATKGDVDDDGILHLFATLPQGDQAIAAGTTLLVHFNAPETSHTVYTRYIELPATTFTNNNLNTININATKSDLHAGLASCDGSDAANAYLIADGYQLAAINSYASTSATTYIKLVDNIDMTGITHTDINRGVDSFAISVNFDGNNKTISKLGKCLFYVFKGTISNLTLDGCNVGTKRGIFAEYCQGTGHTITNVDITNGALNTTSSNSGAMIGTINSGSSGVTTVTIANCEVTNTTVSGAASTGGFIGSIGAKTVVTDCSTSAAVTGSGASVGGFVGSCTEAILTRCSATGAVVKNSANGNFVGGFAGSMEKCTLDGCFATGTVTTTAVTSEHVGGFIGNLKPATGALASIQNCYATGNVNGSGRWTGGFIGYIYRAADNCGDVEISKCHATGNVTVGANKNYVAGFIARSYMYTGSHLTIEKCYATGNVSAAGSGASAFFGEIGEMTTCTISDCYATGNVSGANQQRAGLVAIVNGNANTSATISRCYASGTIDGTFRLGGLIGNLNNSKATVRDCAAWNGAVTATAAVQTNWSSGAIIATAHPNSQVINNFRNPSMSLTVYCPPPTSGWDHPDIEGTTHPLYQNSQTAPFTWAETAATSLSAGTDNVDAGRWAYHGWHTAETRLSTLASAAKGASSGQGGLGWSSEVWDFTADLPTLK